MSPDLLRRNPWADFDETLGVKKVDLELVERQLFDFRFRPKTRRGRFSETGSRKYA